MNETPKASQPLPVEPHAPINPHVMQEMQRLNDRINMQNNTMEAMWNKVRPVTKFYDWVRETHPDILTQYVSIRELEEVGKEIGRTEGYAFMQSGKLKLNR